MKNVDTDVGKAAETDKDMDIHIDVGRDLDIDSLFPDP